MSFFKYKWNLTSLKIAYGLGFFVASIGVGGVVGYVFSSEYLYKWTKGGIGMAINTCICFSLIGLAVMIISETVDRKR